MRNVLSILCVFLLGFGVLVAGSKKVSKASIKQSKLYTPQKETNNYAPNISGNTGTIYQHDGRNGFSSEAIDNSKNGYGMIAAGTKPLFVDSDGQMLAIYRQWCGDLCSSGQLGGTYFGDYDDFTDNDQITNINSTGTMWGCDDVSAAYGGCGVARYPSALGDADYPFAFWNEYTQNEDAGSFGGRPYYSLDNFGWDGGSWSYPADVDIVYTVAKDLWVGSPAVSYDNGQVKMNVAYSDWTRNDIYLFHSEAYEDGFLIMSEEKVVIDENNDLVGGDDEGSYTSQPVLEINEDGVGYVAVTAYFSGAADIPPTSQYSNSHTLIFKATEDHGNTWSGSNTATGNNDYYFVPDDVYDDMFADGLFPTYYQDEDGCIDPETGSVYEYNINELFLAYDFSLEVDSNGDPHFIVGMLPSYTDEATGDGYVLPSLFDNCGFYHLTIDKNYLANPGPTNTATGWNYSFVASTQDSWAWTDAAGGSFWQMIWPSMNFSADSEDVMYVVASMVNEGPAECEDEDPCTADCTYPEWSQDVNVFKSTDGGATWSCPVTSDTPDPDPSDEESPEETYAHAASSGDNDGTHVIFQMPDYVYGSTTGDLGDADYKQTVYVGYADLSSPSYDCDNDDGCGADLGDVGGDGTINILDVIALVNHILGTAEAPVACAADFNEDATVNILDVIALVNSILGGKDASEDALKADVIKADNALSLIADGYIGAVQVALKHDDNFSCENNITFNQNLVSGCITDGNYTNLIVVEPGSDEIFTTNASFEVIEISAANSSDFIDLGIVQKYAIVSNYPNPFNPETTIDYELVVSGNIELAIYNVVGQKVATLVEGFKDIGAYSIVWDGHTQSGVEAPSGVYFLNLKTANDVISEKITLLR